jgi:hypothetical protein
MNFQIGPFIAGAFVFIEGVRIILNPKVYNWVYRYTWDLSGYNVSMGTAIAVAGAWLIWTAFKGKSKRDE